MVQGQVCNGRNTWPEHSAYVVPNLIRSCQCPYRIRLSKLKYFYTLQALPTRGVGLEARGLNTSGRPPTCPTVHVSTCITRR